MVALRLVLSLCLDLPSFLRVVSGFEDRGDDRVEVVSGIGRYREDFGL